jgi:hypothetical protein
VRVRCNRGEHRPVGIYVPGCGLQVWVPMGGWVETFAARCQLCGCFLAGLRVRSVPSESWVPLVELFGQPGERHSHPSPQSTT